MRWPLAAGIAITTVGLAPSGAAQELHLGGIADVRLTATLQIDARGFSGGYDGGEAIRLERRRIGVTGRVLGQAEVEVEYDFARAQPWRDVSVDATIQPWLKVKGGRFKIPFGREAQRSAAKLPFVDRSAASAQIAPARETGMLVHGRAHGRMFEYSAGVFRGSGDNAPPTGETTLAGALAVSPFKGRSPWLKDLSVGAAMTASREPEGLYSLRGATESGFEFFPRVHVNGSRRRTGAHASWAYRHAWAEWEYLRGHDARRAQGLGNVDLAPLIASGWLTSAGIELGRVGLATRYAVLGFSTPAGAGDPQRHARAETVVSNCHEAWTAGVTGRVNRWVRLQLNVTRESFSDVARSPLPLRPLWSVAMRTQAAL